MHLAAVGKCDPDADQYVACHKVKHAPADGGRQNIDPHFVHIQQLTEHKSDHEAELGTEEQIFAQDHQCQHRSPWKIRSGASVTAENTPGKCVGKLEIAEIPVPEYSISTTPKLLIAAATKSATEKQERF